MALNYVGGNAIQQFSWKDSSMANISQGSMSTPTYGNSLHALSVQIRLRKD